MASESQLCRREPDPPISSDSSFTLEAFSEEHDLDFELVSDMAGNAIEAYGLSLDLPDLGLYDVANRAVYVVSEDGKVTYSWKAEDPTNEPDYDELLDAIKNV